MSGDDWPFEDPPNLAVITSRGVMHEGEWIALVSHDEDDGGWQFLGHDGAPREEDAMVVALRRVFEKDPSIGQLADLPLGWQAWRDAEGNPWQRAQRRA